MTMDPSIDNRIVNCGGNLLTITVPKTKEVITDGAHSNAQVIQTPMHVSRMGRYVTTSGDIPHAVSYSQANSPVLVGGIGVYPSSGHSGILQVFNKRQSNIYDRIRDTQKLDTSVDGNLRNDQDSGSIFRKVIGRELSYSFSTELYSRCRMDFSK